MEKIDFVTKREIIELFVNRAIFEIQNTREIPKINCIFDRQGLLLIESVKKKPFIFISGYLWETLRRYLT